MEADKNDDDDDGGQIARDGEVVRCPLYLMDATQRRIADQTFDAAHQPGYRIASDAGMRDARAAALDARDRMIRRAERAWMTPGRDAAEPRQQLQCGSAARTLARR
jgi:hypothetical protein